MPKTGPQWETCAKCGTVREPRAARCKPCRQAYVAGWQMGVGREKRIAAQARYRAAHPERERARHQRDALRESFKAYRASPRAKALARARYEEWRGRNPGLAVERAARWQANNREAYREILSRALHRRRARIVAAFGSFSRAEWNAIVKKQRGRCAICDAKPVKLAKDHIIPLSRGGSNLATNIQGLCRSCNSTKWAHVPRGAQADLWSQPR